MESFSSQTSSMNESQSSAQALELFKIQLNEVQILVEELNSKIIDKTLCIKDITILRIEMQKLADREGELKPSLMLSNFVIYKVRSLKILQESYRISNWIMESECTKIDNLFDINSYIDKIIDSCTNKEDPLDYMTTLFKDCFMNTDNFDLSFYGNITFETIIDPAELTQTKKGYKRSQKRQLEEQVVPVEVDNDAGDNELQITLSRVQKCLERAVSKNNGNPVSFFKFAIDPFSLSHSVENLFNLASLVKDRVVKIEKNSDNDDFELATLIVEKKIKLVNQNKAEDFISSLLTINHDLWKFYIDKYDIQEQMIDH